MPIDKAMDASCDLVPLIRLWRRYRPLFYFAWHYNNCAILCDLYPGNLEPSGEYCLRSSSHIAFFEQASPAHWFYI
jgi:hypothetical protein